MEEDCKSEQEKYFKELKEDSPADPDDQELLWAVQHGCYLSEVFSLLNDNSLETAARQYKVGLRPGERHLTLLSRRRWRDTSWLQRSGGRRCSPGLSRR